MKKIVKIIALGLLSGLWKPSMYGAITRENNSESRPYWSERTNTTGLALKCMAYSQRHPDKQNNINELIKKYPNTIQILMKIACEDDYRTPGIFDVAIQILDQHQATPEALGALFETIADIPYPYAEFDIQRSLPMEAPYSPTIKKTIISLNTYPNIGIALKNICKSELRGEDFAIWKNNQFGNDIEQGRIAEIKSGVQCNPRKRSCVKKSPKETSEEFSM